MCIYIYNDLFYGQCVISQFYVQQTQLKLIFTANLDFYNLRMLESTW